MTANPRIILWLVVLIVSQYACATIVSGTDQQLTFISSPEGAKVTVSGRVIGNTPITIRLKKEQNSILTFEKDGYKPVSLNLSTTLDPWFWGNILLGGFFGSTTDAVSGAANKYSQDQYMVALEPIEGTRLTTGMGASKRDEARNFIILSYDLIMGDISRGSGNYLTTLFALLEIDPNSQSEAIEKLRSLASVYENINEFSDHTTEYYLR